MAMDTEGVGNGVQVVPVVTPPVETQLDVVPVKLKLFKVPVRLLPLASVTVVTPALLVKPEP